MNGLRRGRLSREHAGCAVKYYFSSRDSPPVQGRAAIVCHRFLNSGTRQSENSKAVATDGRPVNRVAIELECRSTRTLVQLVLELLSSIRRGDRQNAVCTLRVATDFAVVVTLAL